MTLRLPTDSARTPIPGQPLPGDVLGGKYRVERELGSGGMGVVFEVTHVVMTKTRFAVKWLMPLSDGEVAMRRFRREARISGAIRHPHVVEVYDVNVDVSGSFMVMELLEGESLATRIERAGALEPSETCALLVQCLSGVAAAHAAGIVHRDLKPANIFLCATRDDSPPHPKVLDFGVSRTVSQSDPADTTHTRDTIVGTPAYMSPEQLRGQECDARTDVYALGVTLYEALTGRRPFEATSAAELSIKILTGDSEPLRKRAPHVPSGLVAIVTRAMHKDAQLRYPTADAFADALQPYAVKNTDSHPPPFGKIAAAPRTRWPWLVAAVLVASALGVFLASRERVARHLDANEHAVSPAPIRPAETAAPAAPRPPEAEAPAKPLPPAANDRLEPEPPPEPSETHPAKPHLRKPKRAKPAAGDAPAAPLEVQQTPAVPLPLEAAPAPEPRAEQPAAPPTPRPKPALKLEGI